MINNEEDIWGFLIGEEVLHKKWSKGKIKSIEGKYMIVDFGTKEVKFLFPDAIDKFLKMEDENIKDKVMKQFKNYDILKKIKEQKIEKFVHFTNVQNLDSILREGLIPVKNLKEKGIEYHFNDIDRLDNRLEASSLSIAFPNYQMFYTYRKKNPNLQWVVISYDAKKVAKKDCAYFQYNAALHIYKNVKWETFISLSAFNLLFSGNREGLYSYETTNPQAEVMVREIIPTDYIDAIYFNDYFLYKFYEQKHPNIKMIYDDYYFTPRRDYMKWSKNYGK